MGQVSAFSTFGASFLDFPRPLPPTRPPMDSLFAKADAIRPAQIRRKGARTSASSSKKQSGSAAPAVDKTLTSVAPQATLPRSLRPTEPLPEGAPTHAHIPNKKLRTQLTRQSAHAARAKALVEDAALLLHDDAGTLQVEDELERTWRVGQSEILQGAGEEAAKGRREWKLDGGPYRCRYSRNGRYVFSAPSASPQRLMMIQGI